MYSNALHCCNLGTYHEATAEGALLWLCAIFTFVAQTTTFLRIALL
jgi:hypothetical protein